MQQYEQGLMVDGYQMNVSTDAQGNLISINGSYAPIGQIDLSVRLSGQDAEARAADYAVQKLGASGDRLLVKAEDPSIWYTEGKAIVGYKVGLTSKGQETVLSRLFVDGNTGRVIGRMNPVLTETRTGDLWGQKQRLRNLLYDREGDLNKMQDPGRKIKVYNANFNQIAPNVNDSNVFPVQWKDGETPDSSGVDALASLERIYDYYLNNFALRGTMNNADAWLDCIVHVTKISSGGSTGNYQGNAAMFSPQLMVVGKGSNQPEMSYNLDIMGHEYNHGVAQGQSNLYTGISGGDPQTSEQYAIGEGMADVFGEFAEDYADDGICNNSCDWIHGTSRDPRKLSGKVKKADDFKPGKTDCHDGAGIVSHPACLMAGHYAADLLGRIWFEAEENLTGQSTFEDLRRLVETATLLRHGNGVSDDQIGNLLDAFDSAGVNPVLNAETEMTVLQGTVIKVTDKDGKPCKSCHLEISWADNGPVVSSRDMKAGEFKTDLKPGIYNFRLTDSNHPDLTVTRRVYINKKVKGSKVSYQKKPVIKTPFSEKSRSAVLVLDNSGSMQGTPLQQTKEAAAAFVRTVLEKDPATRISLVGYSSTASCLIQDSSDLNALAEAIQSMQASGQTNIREACQTAASILKNEQTDSRLMVVMSDGLPTAGETENGSFDEPILAETDQAKKEGVTVYTLGFFHNSSADEKSQGQSLMSRMATEGYAYDVAAADSIQYVFDDIARQVSGKGVIYIKIECPVDVSVRCDGQELNSASDGSGLRTGFGTLSVTGNPGDTTKILRLDADREYEVSIRGTGSGVMNYTIRYPDKTGKYTDTRTFRDIPVNPESYAVARTEEGRKNRMQVDLNGDGRFDSTYTAGKNRTADISSGRSHLWLIVFPALAAVFILYLFRILTEYSKLNRFKRTCRHCGLILPRYQNFCPRCGSRMPPAGLRLPQEMETEGLKIAKVLVSGIAGLLLIGLIGLYRMPATTAYHELQNGNLISAERIYDAGVKNWTLSRNYMNLITGCRLRQIRRAEKKNRISRSEAQSYYEAIAGMSMGSSSDKAGELVKNKAG